ncbi:MAG TPA: VOC family protein [Candidatus Limiplasma sp.]|nr:VOC family protein [Candidatus Limiplasma sp.]
MKLSGVCILTNNAPRLVAFYTLVLQETPVTEGSHYGFAAAQLAVYDPGSVPVSPHKNMQLMYIVPDLTAEYERLLRVLPTLCVTSPPTHRPWGAFSCWFSDPDGNTISLIERKEEA